MCEDTNTAAACKPCKIKEFFNRQHTPIEKGLMVAAGLMTGIVIGMVISPVRGGIGLEVSLGSHNGCGNYDNDCSKTIRKS
ncbi:hypothetical protein [Emergencia sp.]|uniref:hypothetical protein n=1 Tax=Emergencia sp. TaxID=1926557 RepID=UPI003AF0C018